MNIEVFREYCLAKAGTSEGFPFGEDTLVFKVMDKMFALTQIEVFESVNLKCDPEKAVEFREKYNEIKPGYHMNKKHWNTVSMNGSLSDRFILDMIDHSYNLVVKSLPIKIQHGLRSE